MRAAVECAIIKLECIAVIVLLPGHTKTFRYIIIYGKHSFAVHFIDVTAFQT